MKACKRIVVPPSSRPANGNIRTQYAIENASWIWHPALRVDEPAAVRFTRRFRLAKPVTTRLHVSADQRYELTIDGQWVSMGPDRSDLNHWSFASYEVSLEAGEHEVQCLVWWIGELAPHAQVSARGGFILAAEGLAGELNTGTALWQAQRVRGWSFEPTHINEYHVIGPKHIIDGAACFGPQEEPAAPVVVAGPIPDGDTGAVCGIWGLHPSPLPDMIHRPVCAGVIRAVTGAAPAQPLSEAACRSPQIASWQGLIGQGQSVTVPAGTKVHVLWDLDQYYCGYSSVTVSGGRGASVGFDWAEALYELGPDGKRVGKGRRDQVQGKIFHGFGDRFISDGERRTYRSFWWRSGRYVLLTVRTAEEPLTFERAEVVETRYPYEPAGRWSSSDAALDDTTPIMIRALQMCSHETYMDCPYYEQMMYVGDTRLEMLAASLMFADPRLTRRGIELFDWSRWRTGFVAERYPSMPFQLSLTFAMIWMSMVRDYALWHDDAAFVRARMVGVRGMIECFLPLVNERGLLEDVPGWSFVDWVPSWPVGYAPDGKHGVSSVVNLLFVQGLQHAADLEDAYGEPALAGRCRALARRTGEAVAKHFWDDARGMLADDLAHKHFSEHAQSLAILTDVLTADRQKAALEHLLADKDLARTTVYFSFYLLEAMYKMGRGDVIHAKLDFWKALRAGGFKTTVEAPEPSRSDCHAWGAHPYYHMHASLAGIRPAGCGFGTVRIAPCPGPLTKIDAVTPHPRGQIVTALRLDASGACHATITLPPGVGGEFIWRGKSHPLTPGATTNIEAK